MDEAPVIVTRRKGRNQIQRMLIPCETMLAAELKSAPAGQLSDLGAVRQAMAEKYGTDACCPVTIQRHLITLSQDGDAPIWRVIDPDRAFAKRLEDGRTHSREAGCRTAVRERKLSGDVTR